MDPNAQAGTPASEGQQQQAPAQRPEGVPEKFWDPSTGQVRVDDLVKSYSELEKKVSAPKAPTIPVAPEGQQQAPSAAAQAAAEGNAPPALQSLLDEATASFSEKGAVDPSIMEKLAKAGLPAEYVTETLEAVAVVALQRAQKAAGDAVGDPSQGAEVFTKAIEWAAATMPPEEIASYNRLAGDRKTMDFAVKSLVAQYQKAMGSEGTSVTNNNPSVPGGPDQSVYGSAREMADAMSDVRYKEDATYRQMVQDKTVRTRRSGKVIF